MVASPLPIIDSEIAHESRGVPFGGRISHLPTKFLPLVSAMLKVTGNKLAVPVQRQSISQALAPGTDLKSLGFTSFDHYLKQAIEARIVGTGDDGAQSSVHLISDLERWCHAYVVRHLPPASKILSGPYTKGTAFYPLYQMARSLMMTQFLQEVPVNWVNKLVFRKNPTLLQDHGYASGKHYTKAAIVLGVASLSSSGSAYILRYEEAWSHPAP
ncbi:hypothetical protein CPB86DRAFT_451426 [Serendipita vermifera]|nr:hypothetical protein CPB86DRAFT_451426 [Serendipita vermifera]